MKYLQLSAQGITFPKGEQGIPRSLAQHQGCTKINYSEDLRTKEMPRFSIQNISQHSTEYWINRTLHQQNCRSLFGGITLSRTQKESYQYGQSQYELLPQQKK